MRGRGARIGVALPLRAGNAECRAGPAVPAKPRRRRPQRNPRGPSEAGGERQGIASRHGHAQALRGRPSGGARGRPILTAGFCPLPWTARGPAPGRPAESSRGAMRPTTAILLPFFFLSLAVPALAQAPAQAAAAASAAAQALPLAKVPDLVLVPAGVELAAPDARRGARARGRLGGGAAGGRPGRPGHRRGDRQGVRRARGDAPRPRRTRTSRGRRRGRAARARRRAASTLLPELDHDLAQLQARVRHPHRRERGGRRVRPLLPVARGARALREVARPLAPLPRAVPRDPARGGAAGGHRLPRDDRERLRQLRLQPGARLRPVAVHRLDRQARSGCSRTSGWTSGATRSGRRAPRRAT